MGTLLRLFLSQFLGQQDAIPNLVNLMGSAVERLRSPSPLGMLERLAELIPPGKEAEATAAIQKTLEGLVQYHAIIKPTLDAREKATATELVNFAVR